jgi:hypothetical protein
VIYSESLNEVANGKARVPHEIDAEIPEGWFAQKRSTLAAAIVFTSPGVPMIFREKEFLSSVVSRQLTARLGSAKGIPRHRTSLSRPHFAVFSYCPNPH